MGNLTGKSKIKKKEIQTAKKAVWIFIWSGLLDYQNDD